VLSLRAYWHLRHRLAVSALVGVAVVVLEAAARLPHRRTRTPA
jgi:hypothetical protein